jgi:predicted GIY-YIG superfamily endonuclease
MRQPAVYILASARNGTLYIGVTANLPLRLADHQSKSNPNSFTARYGATHLVWWEAHDTMSAAIQREKTSKNGRENGNSNSSKPPTQIGTLSVPRLESISTLKSEGKHPITVIAGRDPAIQPPSHPHTG